MKPKALLGNLGKLVQKHGSLLAPVFFLVAFGLTICLPLFGTQKMRIDENGLQAGGRVAVPVKRMPSTEPVWRERLVRGPRANGAEVIAVYVSLQAPTSVQLAHHLIDIITHNKTLACNVQFYFFDENDPTPLPRPSVFTRASIVLRVTSYFHSVCLDSYGKNGGQPNRDLAASFLGTVHLTPICASHTNSSLEGFFYSLKRSIAASVHPRRWHSLPSSTITFSSGEQPAHQQMSEATALNHYAELFTNGLARLSNAEEDFHHAAHSWYSTSEDHYVAFNAVQFVIILSAACCVAVGYGVYVKQGVGVSLSVLLLPVLGVSLHLVHRTAGMGGVVVLSVVLVGAYGAVRQSCMLLLTVNVILLGLSIGFHPAMGVVGGLGLLGQTIWLLPAPLLQTVVCQCVAAVVAWVVFYALVVDLDLTLDLFHDFPNAFACLCLYPTAVWVSSRLVNRLWYGDSK